MYEALGAILPYFKKAYELDQLPNEKGKIKPKYSKDIKSILGADHVYFFNGGAYYFDQKIIRRLMTSSTSIWKSLNCLCSKELRLLKKILLS